MAIPSYTSLEVLRLRLGLSDSTYDVVLAEILEGVGAAIQAYLGFDPTVTSITEYADGNGSEIIWLKRWPVTAVTAVYENANAGNYGQGDDPFPASTELEQGTQYVWAVPNGSTVGQLIRLKQFWPYLPQVQPVRLSALQWYNRGAIKVTYTVDNANLLLACKQSAYLEAAAQFRSMATGMGAILSESIDGYQVSVSAFQKSKVGSDDSADGFVSPQAAGLLRPWRLTRMV